MHNHFSDNNICTLALFMLHRKCNKLKYYNLILVANVHNEDGEHAKGEKLNYATLNNCFIGMRGFHCITA